MARWTISNNDGMTRVVYTNTATGQTHVCGERAVSAQTAVDWIVRHGSIGEGDTVEVAGMAFRVGPGRTLQNLSTVRA